MNGGPLRTVAVVGDGVAGWLAAAAFARRVAGVRVALVPGGRAGLADRLGGTTPAVHDFHHDLRIDTRDLIVRTGAALRDHPRGDYALSTKVGRYLRPSITEFGATFPPAVLRELLIEAGGAEVNVKLLSLGGGLVRGLLVPLSDSLGLMPQ